MQNVVWHYLAVISKTFLGKDRLGGPKPACNALLISNRVFNLLSINLIRSVGGLALSNFFHLLLPYHSFYENCAKFKRIQ